MSSETRSLSLRDLLKGAVEDLRWHAKLASQAHRSDAGNRMHEEADAVERAIDALRAQEPPDHKPEWCQRHELWWSGPYKCCPVCHMMQWHPEPVKGAQEPPQAQLLEDFARRLIASQKDLPPEAAKVLRDNLWELLGDTPVPATQEPPQIKCPLCGAVVKQVASATIDLALWQHVNWTHCRSTNYLSLPRGARR